MKQVKNKFLSGHPIIAQLLSLIPTEILSEAVEQENADCITRSLNRQTTLSVCSMLF